MTARTRIPPRVVATPPEPRPTQGFSTHDWLLLGTLVGVVAVYRFVVLAIDAGPPGSDGGNWLAYTEDLFGDSPNAAASMYFPGTLVLLKLLLLVLPPLLAVKTLAVLSSVLVAVPFYWLARHACPSMVAVLLALLLLMAGFLIEMMTWGGYPQLLGTACVLATLYFLDRWLVDGEGRDWLWAGVATALVFATHHFTVLVLAASLAVYLPWIAWHRRTELPALIRRARYYVIAAAVLSLLTLPWYLRYVSLPAGDGSLYASSDQISSLGDVFSYVYSEAPLTWIFLTAIVPLLERVVDVILMALLALLGAAVAGAPLLFALVGLIAGAAAGVVLANRRAASAMVSLIHRTFGETAAGHARAFYEPLQSLWRPRPLVIAFGLGALAWLGECAAFFVVLGGLGLAPNLELAGDAAFIYPLANLAAGLSLLPGGLGVAEGIIAGLMVAQTAAGAPAALAAAVLIRATIVGFGILSGLPGLLYVSLLARGSAPDRPVFAVAEQPTNA